MAFVLDASIAICWAFEDEADSVAQLAWSRCAGNQEEVVAPGLWWMEVRNGLIVNERRQRTTEARTTVFLKALSSLPVTLDRSPDELALLALARNHRLTVYDAAYLELARRLGLPLATLDRALAVAARVEKVPLLGEA